jgi:hypothetical protein
VAVAIRDVQTRGEIFRHDFPDALMLNQPGDGLFPTGHWFQVGNMPQVAFTRPAEYVVELEIDGNIPGETRFRVSDPDIPTP